MGSGDGLSSPNARKSLSLAHSERKFGVLAALCQNDLPFRAICFAAWSYAVFMREPLQIRSISQSQGVLQRAL
jgi:hypothetical protein